MITEEHEFEEPITEFEYNGDTYPSWGNVRGNYKTVEYDTGKFNRYAKIGSMADTLIDDFKNTLIKQPKSIEARCAYACLMMMEYGVRVGNEDSAEGYVSGLEKNKGEVVQTFGTTTLQNEHIKFIDGKMRLAFLGKEQVKHDIVLTNPLLIKYGKFYADSAQSGQKWLGVDYDTVFKFVKNRIGAGFVPKDLRTFCANVTAWNTIKTYLDKPSKHEKISDAKKEVKDIVEVVAARLGNTPGIAKRAYIDGRMLDWFIGQRFDQSED